MLIDKVNLAEKFSKFNDHFSPKIVGELNGQQVKLVKFAGPFVWHHHEHEDELFYVVKGKLKMQLREKSIEIFPGEFIIIPKGTEHCPDADEEVWIMLFEPATTLNTGNTENDLTKKELQII